MATIDKRIFALIGPSGSGKTTIGEYLKKSYNFSELVSTTTRAMRPGEKQGEAYNFVTEEEFNKLNMIERVTYSGNMYGLAEETIRDTIENNVNMYAVLNIEGANMIRDFCKKHYPNTKVYFIFFLIDGDIAAERMRARGDTEENIKKRLNYCEDAKENGNIIYADFVINNSFNKFFSRIQARTIILGTAIRKK